MLGAAREGQLCACWVAGGREGDVTRGAQLFGFRVQATLGGRSTLKEGHGKGMLHEEVEQESTADRNLHPTVRSGAGADQRLQPSWGEPPSGPGLKVAAALSRAAVFIVVCTGAGCVLGEGLGNLGLEGTPMMLALWFWVCTGISSSERKSNSLLERHALHLVRCTFLNFAAPGLTPPPAFCRRHLRRDDARSLVHIARCNRAAEAGAHATRAIRAIRRGLGPGSSRVVGI